MLLLAGFTYWQVRNVLHGAVQEQLRQTTSRLIEELEQKYAGIDSTLGALAGTLAERSSATGALPGYLAEAEVESALPLAAYVGLRDEPGLLRLLAGSEPAELIRCADGEISRGVVFSRELPGRVAHNSLEAGVWVSDLLGGAGVDREHGVVVFDSAEGVVLFSNRRHAEQSGEGCEEGWNLGLDQEVAGSRGAFRTEEGDGGKIVAVAHVGDLGWRVVATSSVADVLGPLRRLIALYWLFVLMLGLLTAIAFSILIGPFTQSLSELTRAAEEIGLGELDPWLPLQTSGELGQLTAAFSGMLSRIRQMIAQVDQSGRLAVVGQLSAYLAHEIRNPLSSIKLNLQRMRRWTRSGDLPEYCMEPLEISLREVERLNASVTGVLQLSRSEDSPREIVNLHALVEEASDLLAPKFRRQGVGLSLELDAGADRILARVGQVKSAVLNLMVNALEAQPNGGRLEIRSTLSRVPEMGGPVVSLHFRDWGPGVPSEIRDRIFEPFFTTKPGGSGIGLAMASQSVRANGGQLYLEPSFMVGEGSDFVAVFPLAALEATAGVSRTSAGAAHSVSVPSSSRASAEGRTLPAALAPGLVGGEEQLQDEAEVPTHLLTPEGLRAVLALSRPDPEEVN